ncbi:MAG: DUF1887 family CARF protein [Ignavibacterium sp.]|nr:DUF1887 family CARF protein [Ignavibacterium sp.]MDW8376452.1 DUF1887 family CARF protein [Ignavibacteriales bacterium]
METMFCLVSRQTMANVLPVLMYNPKKVILFATPEEKNSADNLEKLFKSKRINVKRNDGLDAYDYVNFKSVVKNELDLSMGETWLNVTGGTKLMALAAYEAFAEKNRKIIYCNTERKQIIHLYPNPISENLELTLDINDYLISYGYEIISSRTDEFNDNHKKIFDILVQKGILSNFSDFLDIYRSQVANFVNLRTFIDKRNRIFSIQRTPNGIILFIENEKFKFDDDKFLKGDWLEFFMLYHLSNLGINSELGVKITSSGNVENEIDLIFIKNYQLYLISCKSGRNNDPNRDIYEVETLRNIAGGTYGKAFLFTTQPLTQRIAKRAAELRIKTIDLQNLDKVNF